jgi:hypothetical protein
LGTIQQKGVVEANDPDPGPDEGAAPPVWPTVRELFAQIRGGALAILGVFWFLLIQRAYDHFYGKFDVSPTDVGVDLSIVVYRAAYSLLLYGFLVLLLVYGTMETIAVLWRMVTHQAGSRKTPWPDLMRRLRGRVAEWTFLPARMIATLFIFFLFTTVYFLLATVPINNLVERIRRGESVETVTRISPLVWVRAERVQVEWIDPAETSRLPGGQGLMYLGSNEGVMVMYDLCREMPIRIPAERVVITPVESDQRFDAKFCRPT